MAVNHQIGYSWTSASRSRADVVAKSSGAEINADKSVASGGGDAAQGLAWTNSLLKSLYIVSSEDVILKSNAGSDTVINLVAGVPLVWHDSCYYTNPFSAADVTEITVNNASGRAATVIFRLLLDPTP